MLRRHSLVAVAQVAALAAASCLLVAGRSGPASPPPARLILHEEGLRDPRPGSAELGKSSTDTLDLYGGPGVVDGKFEDALGNADWQGWTSADRTEQGLYWHVSTFNAETLGGHGLGNHAMWCGQDVGDAPTASWSAAPGYGNGWVQDLVFRSGSLVDPSVGQTVDLDFFFHHDSEPGYDFFTVEYDSAGSWQLLLRVDGSDSPNGTSFTAPGVQFSLANPRSIVFAGNDYAGPGNDEIVLRLRFTSDGAFSDEDGLWPTDGAVQADDIRVRWIDDGLQKESFEDFEGSGPYAWTPERQPYVGDFAKLFSSLSHPDPCASNSSSVVTFIDDQTPPSNPSNQPPVSTGGSLPSFLQWSPPSYGTPGGWVVNYTDGLDDDGFPPLFNEVISPPIAFDLPGSGDDGPEWAAAVLEYDAMLHAPLLTGIFHLWQVRTSSDGGSSWSRWGGDNFVYFSSFFGWQRVSRDLTDFLTPTTTHLQISLQVRDVARLFSFPGDDATPAPWLDNVRVRKIRLSGPRIGVRDIDQFQDSFPPVGNIDVSTAAARDQLDVPVNMAQSPSLASVGDSMVATVENIIAGASLNSLTLEWIADTNPLFEEALRSNRPTSAQLQGGQSPRGWPQWRGSQSAGPVVTTWGGTIADKFAFDFPDVDFFYPGDEIRYFVRAEDQLGRVSLAPPDTAGFESGEGYDDRFRVRALPSLLDELGTQPRILLIDDSGREAAHGSLRELFAGLVANNNFSPSTGADTYVVRGASSEVDNGIGSAPRHGATIDQLENYLTILYSSGVRTGVSLGDGSGFSGMDTSDDVGLLTAWHSRPGNRAIAHIGSGFVQGLQTSAAGVSYQSFVGVDYLGPDLSSATGSPSTLTLQPANSWFQREYQLQGFCPSGRRFDHLAALFPGPQALAYEYATGLPPQPAAGVIHEFAGGLPKTVLPWPSDVAVTLGFDLAGILRSPPYNDDAATQRALLLDLGGPLGYGLVDTDAPPTARAELAELSTHPNPFNPRVAISFRLGVADRMRIDVFDLRGRRVRRLLDARLPAGRGESRWDGLDDHGHAVASGVYVLRLRSNGEELRRKVALVQ